MNMWGCVATALEIDKKYMEPLCLNIERNEEGCTLAHLRWMVQEIGNDMSINKAMRWLGYIQGMLVAMAVVSLHDMKELSKKYAEKAKFEPGDVVHLVSGSPKMVVTAVYDDYCDVIGHIYGTSLFIDQKMAIVALRKHI